MRTGAVWLVAACVAVAGASGLSGAPAAGAADATPAALKGPRAAYEQGLERVEQGRREEALSAFRRALEEAAAVKHPQAAVLVSTAANNAGNLLLLQGKPQEAEAYYRRAVAADPKHALAINNLGVALLKQGKLQEAVKTFEQAIEAEPHQGLAHNNLASLLMRTGELKRAAQLLAAALKLNPRNEQTLLQMAQLYALANKPEMQPQIWQTLVKTTDGSLQERLRLGSWYLQARILPQAERVFEELLQERPEWPEARLQRARVQALTGQANRALKELQDLLPLLPKEPGVRTDLAALLLKADRVPEAETQARQAVAAFPKDAKGWFVLGCVQERLKQTLDAEKSYYEAVRLDRACGDAWNNLGVLAAKRNDVNTALTCYMAALFADPYDPEAQYNLGRSLVIGKKDYARGVRLLVAASSGSGAASQRAQAFLADLETISKGGDPGWQAAGARQGERR